MDRHKWARIYEELEEIFDKGMPNTEGMIIDDEAIEMYEKGYDLKIAMERYGYG